MPESVLDKQRVLETAKAIMLMAVGVGQEDDTERR
jgi:hypothetical protein